MVEVYKSAHLTNVALGSIGLKSTVFVSKVVEIDQQLRSG